MIDIIIKSALYYTLPSLYNGSTLVLHTNGVGSIPTEGTTFRDFSKQLSEI